jgi:hypothetical protein
MAKDGAADHWRAALKRLGGTSTTVISVITGPVTLVTQAGLAYRAGVRVRLSAEGQPQNWIEGTVTSYADTSMSVNVDLTGGSGAFPAWDINLAGDSVENAWWLSGDLNLLAVEVGMCRMRNEPPPEWLHKALLDLAAASEADKPYAKAARRLAPSLVRYVAVREAHDREGLSWDKAPERASERLRGQPAEASPNHMWSEYKRVRKLMRAAGTVRDDDDPGYHWIEDPPKSPG